MSDDFLSYVRPEPPDVASPCTGVCVIGDDDLCEGCARTIEEIAGWGTAGFDERRSILAALSRRREGLRKSISSGGGQTQ